jgi:oligopeptide transport system permease protein
VADEHRSRWSVETDPGRTLSDNALGPAADGLEPAAALLGAPVVPGRPRRLVWTRPTLLLPALVVAFMVVIGLAPQLFAGWFGHGDPLECQLRMSSRGPSSGHPFGFDVQGCDLYANVVHGARPSISIGLLTTAATLLIAVVLGTVAGYFGGWVDMLISRVMDVFFGFPALVGMIVILSVWNRHDVLSISAMLTLFTWPGLTRVMRASVIETRSLDYVQAAVGVGVGTTRLLVRHVGLNAIGPVIVLAGLNIGAVITAEAALTFLGVGLQSPTISWGVQLNTAQQYLGGSPHLLVFPSLFLSVTVLGFVMLGDALRDALDPKLTA